MATATISVWTISDSVRSQSLLPSPSRSPSSSWAPPWPAWLPERSGGARTYEPIQLGQYRTGFSSKFHRHSRRDEHFTVEFPEKSQPVHLASKMNGLVSATGATFSVLWRTLPCFFLGASGGRPPGTPRSRSHAVRSSRVPSSRRQRILRHSCSIKQAHSGGVNVSGRVVAAWPESANPLVDSGQDFCDPLEDLAGRLVSLPDELAGGLGLAGD